MITAESFSRQINSQHLVRDPDNLLDMILFFFTSKNHMEYGGCYYKIPYR